jgi:hypothetical protein
LSATRLRFPYESTGGESGFDGKISVVQLAKAKEPKKKKAAAGR